MKIKKTCVVTGGAGFIGSNLCASLIDKGYTVICLDNLLTGNENNLAKFHGNKNFRFIKYDITDNPESELKGVSVDYIYHLASPASPPQYRRYSIETLLVNSQGTYNMLNMAKRKKSRFLLASTSEVYGDPKEHPQKETYYGHVNPVGLRSCYDESKRFAESITMEFVRKFKVGARIIRIFNTYGPNMQVEDGRVISNFITQAIKDKNITIFGAGQQTRSFCFVSDLVSGLISAMETPSLDGKIINLGNPQEMTIHELALLVLKLTGSASKIVKLDKRLQDDPEKRRPDITLAKKYIKFDPKVSLQEGLKKTIGYFRNIN